MEKGKFSFPLNWLYVGVPVRCARLSRLVSANGLLSAIILNLFKICISWVPQRGPVWQNPKWVNAARFIASFARHLGRAEE